MQKFIKENIVLVIGLSLPVFLIILFMLSIKLPAYFVAKPQYDLIFSDPKYSTIEFVVLNGKVHIRNSAGYHGELSIPKLYRYSVATGKVEQISFDIPDSFLKKNTNSSNAFNKNINVTVDPNNLPTEENAQNTAEIVAKINGEKSAESQTKLVDALANVKIDNSVFAPDEYRFINNDYNSDFMGGLIGHRGRYKGINISKNGNNIAIDYKPAKDQYYSTPSFIGWIIP